MPDWKTLLEIANLFVGSGVIVLLFKVYYKWNTVLDRVDLLYKEYADNHEIPFKGLKNDYE